MRVCVAVSKIVTLGEGCCSVMCGLSCPIVTLGRRAYGKTKKTPHKTTPL